MGNPGLLHLALPRKQKDDGWHGLLAARVRPLCQVFEHGLPASRATQTFFADANVNGS
jgi:hypothetical protein